MPHFDHVTDKNYLAGGFPASKVATSQRSSEVTWCNFPKMPTLIPVISTESQAYAKLPAREQRRIHKLGTLSCISLITNKMIGTGLFSTPSIIYKYCNGNVAIFLSLWVIGAIITLSGLLIYLEYALKLPFRNGGEKNYLLRVFQYPKGLSGCIYAFQIVFLGFSSGNSFAFGKYLWYAISGDQSSQHDWPAKLIGVGCITLCTYLHIKWPNQGTALFNFLGMFKIFILCLIVGIGFLVGIGLVNIPQTPVEYTPDLTENSLYSVAVALLEVVYSFKGWENVNYVLQELEDPYRALTFVAPISVIQVTILYFLVVVSYLIVIPKQELLSSGVLIAGIFFNKVFGESLTLRLLPVLISFLTLGNVMVVSFAHSHVNKELAHENYLPFSHYFEDINHSLLLHWFISVLILVGPPSSEIYEFVVNLYIYPGTWINLAITIGIIYLKWNSEKEHWNASSQSRVGETLPDEVAPIETVSPIEDVTSDTNLTSSSSIHSYNAASDNASDYSYTEFDLLLLQASHLGSKVHKTFSAPWICICVFFCANLFLAVFPFVPPPSNSWNQKSIPYWCFPVVGTGCLLLGALFFYGRAYYYKAMGWASPSYEEKILED